MYLAGISRASYMTPGCCSRVLLAESRIITASPNDSRKSAMELDIAL